MVELAIGAGLATFQALEQKKQSDTAKRLKKRAERIGPPPKLVEPKDSVGATSARRGGAFRAAFASDEELRLGIAGKLGV